jgi:small subunit ribosomal protein S4
VVAVRERARNLVPILGALEVINTKRIPSWLTTDQDKLEIRVLAQPSREDIDVPVQEQLIVELYSK